MFIAGMYNLPAERNFMYVKSRKQELCKDGARSRSYQEEVVVMSVSSAL